MYLSAKYVYNMYIYLMRSISIYFEYNKIKFILCTFVSIWTKKLQKSILNKFILINLFVKRYINVKKISHKSL